MVNRTINLIVDHNDVEIAKSQGINLSLFFREALSIKLANREIEQMSDPKDQIVALNNKLSMMAEALASKNNEIEKLQMEIKRISKENEGLKRRLNRSIVYVPD